MKVRKLDGIVTTTGKIWKSSKDYNYNVLEFRCENKYEKEILEIINENITNRTKKIGSEYLLANIRRSNEVFIKPAKNKYVEIPEDVANMFKQAREIVIEKAGDVCYTNEETIPYLDKDGEKIIIQKYFDIWSDDQYLKNTKNDTVEIGKHLCTSQTVWITLYYSLKDNRLHITHDGELAIELYGKNSGNIRTYQTEYKKCEDSLEKIREELNKLKIDFNYEDIKNTKPVENYIILSKFHFEVSFQRYIFFKLEKTDEKNIGNATYFGINEKTNYVPQLLDFGYELLDTAKDNILFLISENVLKSDMAEVFENFKAYRRDNVIAIS